jgi:RND family efflux transporter MFP subunit
MWIVALVIIGLGAYAAVARPWESRSLVVRMETVVRGPIAQVLAVNGRVAPRRSVALRSTVQARLVAISVDIGDEVVAGQLIAQLDDAQPSSLVEQAAASLDAGEVRSEQARVNLERSRALQGNIPLATLNNAEAEYNASRNEVARLQALLKQARDQLDQYAFRAPFDGVIISRAAEQGQIVDTQAELFTIADLGELLVETDVDELYSSQIRTGLKALLKPAGGTAAHGGTVSFAAPTVDAQTGGRAIKISFDVPQSLPIGLTVNANIIVSENPDALSVPRSALIIEGTRSFVLVAEAGTASRREVTFRDWPANRLEIMSGLDVGELVIVEPDQVAVGQAVAPAGA